MFLEIEKDNLEELLHKNKSYIVIYGAAWCGNCRILKPRAKRLSTTNKDIDFFYVDADKFPNSRYLVKLTNLPTTVGVKNGEVVGTHIGNKIEGVEELISQLK